jgi:hypothetical protein
LQILTEVAYNRHNFKIIKIIRVLNEDMMEKAGTGKKTYSAVWLSILLLCIFPFMGCKGGIKSYTRPSVQIETIRKVAVLPVENYTNEKFAHDKIRGVVIMELLSRGVDVIEPGEVMNTLRELKINRIDSLPLSDIQRLGEALNADALVTGSVGTYEIKRGMTVTYPEVSVHLMLLDSATGDIVWSVWHTTGGPDFWTRHFGAENATLEETSKKVVKEAIDTLF